MTESVRYLNLPDVLKSIADASLEIESSLILTYEFSPALAAQLARTGTISLEEASEEDDSARLTWQGRFPAVLFMDAGRMQADPRVPGNFALRFRSKTGFGCHHSKAYAFNLSDGSCLLVLGSFNFTPSGLASNREVLLSLRLTPETIGTSPDLTSVFREWRAFVADHYTQTDDLAVNHYLQGLDRLLALAPSTDADNERRHPIARLIMSGYDLGSDTHEHPSTHHHSLSGLDFLTDFVRGRSLVPSALTVVSPFFDRHRSRVLGDILSRFPSIERINVHTSDRSVASKAYWGDTSPRVRCFLIPETVDEHEAKQLAKARDLNASRLEGAARALHAKLLILSDASGRAILYMGSANFTRNAWGGKNAELGLAFDTVIGNLQDPNAFVSSLLHVTPVETALSDEPITEQDTSDDEAPAPFPTWLESLTLKTDGTSRPYVQYAVRSDTSDIDACLTTSRGLFTTTEGDACVAPQGFPTTVGGLRSKPLDDQIAKALMTSRVIRWQTRPGADALLLPLNIDPALGVRYELMTTMRPEHGLAHMIDLLTRGPARLARSETSEGSALSDDKKIKSHAADKPADDDVLPDTVNRCLRDQIRQMGELERLLLSDDAPPVLRPDLPVFLDTLARCFESDEVHYSAFGSRYLAAELALLGARVCRRHPPASASLAAPWRTFFTSCRNRRVSAASHPERAVALYQAFLDDAIDTALKGLPS